MATIPTTFERVRPGDVNNRKFQAYKHYEVSSDNFLTSSGFSRYDAVYLGTEHPEINVGDPTYNYAVNNESGVNKHVMWHGLDHKYYQNPFDPAKSKELFDIENVEKLLWYSASILSIPYFDMGEGIKRSSVELTAFSKDINLNITDDGHGNLRDQQIETASFASASRCILHLSFNNEYRQFRFQESNLGMATKKFKYFLKGADTDLNHPQKQTETVHSFNNVEIVDGVRTTGVDQTSGLAARFINSSSFIRISHHKDGIPASNYQRNASNLFDRFGKCDDYSISFWVKKGSNDTGAYSIASKNVVKRDHVYDPITNTTSIRDVITEPPNIGQNFDNHRTPFAIGVECNGTDETVYHFHSSNGTNSLHLSGSTTTTTGAVNTSWDHILVRNKNSTAELFINGISADSGIIPPGSVANDYDIILGSTAGFLGVAPPPPSGSINISSPITTSLILPSNVTRYCNTDLIINSGVTLTVSSNTVLIIDNDLNIADNASIIVEDNSKVFVANDLILNGTAEVELIGDAELIFDAKVSEDGDVFYNPYDLAEFRLYEYAVDDNAVSSLSNRHYLSGSLYQSNVMGNVFYKNGVLVTTSPLQKHTTGSGIFLSTGNDSFDLKYRGIHTIYENEVMVRVPQGKMNVSQNPSATFRKPTDQETPCLPNENQSEPGSFRRSMFVSGTANPYITTIGLYDEHLQLLAVGKLSQALQKRPDIDTNIILRWDY
jgi:hypothetical protein